MKIPGSWVHIVTGWRKDRLSLIIEGGLWINGDIHYTGKLTHEETQIQAV